MLAGLLLLVGPGSAIGGQVFPPDVDLGSIYEDGEYYAREGNYEKALNEFNHLTEPYGFSEDWKSYCEGILALRQATALESQGCIRKAKEAVQQAVGHFEDLSASAFSQYINQMIRSSGSFGEYGGSLHMIEDLLTYCRARNNELMGGNQMALDLYSKLPSVEDSRERSLRLRRGEFLDLTECRDVIVLSSISAHADGQIVTRLGPGPDYRNQEIVQVDERTDIRIRGMHNEYYLIEIPAGNGQLLRCWALVRKIQTNASTRDLVDVGMKANERRMTVRTETATYWGPNSTEYLETGYTIGRGTVVTAFEPEDAYTMIEFVPADSLKKVRVWIQSDALTD